MSGEKLSLEEKNGAVWNINPVSASRSVIISYFQQLGADSRLY